MGMGNGIKCPLGEHKAPPAIRAQERSDDHGQPIQSKYDEGADVNIDIGSLSQKVWLVGLLVVGCILAFFVPILTIIFGGAVMRYFFVILVVAAILAFLAKNIRVVPQANAFVIERLGKYHTTWGAGLHIKLPLLDRIAHKTSLKEQVMDFEPQSVITKDNVSMKIDTVVFLHVIDPQLLAYGVEHAIPAIENLTATTLRNLIGELTLDETLTSRDTINVKMQNILDEATDPWGIKVNRVELKNIIPPRDIQEAMEKQMRAEREKREAILRAEGSKEAKILEAKGAKEAVILQAEAAKEKAILEAQADREAAITRAEGEAEAVRKVKEAEAYGIAKIKEAGADDSVVRLRSLDALETMATGPATTIVIPSDLAGMAGTLAGLKATLEKK